MIPAVRLLAALVLALAVAAPVEAFATTRPPSRAVICKSPAGGRSGRGTPLSPSSLCEQPPSQTSVTIASVAADAMDLTHDAVTLVGKSASTLVSASFFVLLAFKRDAVILGLWIGSIINAISSKVAKKVLNHERPQALQDSEKIRLKPSDGGMPSSHAMSLGFIGVSILGGVIPAEHRIVAGSLMAIYSAMALRYRVRDHLHTTEQVAVGLTSGIANALAWLRFAIGRAGDGPVLSWVRENFVSAETGLFPYSALGVPIVVGILVVGSFERRIALWLKEKGKKDD